jgi:hypothetical protein
MKGEGEEEEEEEEEGGEVLRGEREVPVGPVQKVGCDGGAGGKATAVEGWLVGSGWARW